jgi:hypothetical protein
MLGGIFAAAAPARWCRPAWLPEFRTDQLIGVAVVAAGPHSAGTRTAAATGDPVGVHNVRIARIDGQRLLPPVGRSAMALGPLDLFHVNPPSDRTADSADVIDAGQVCEPKVTRARLAGRHPKVAMPVESSAAVGTEMPSHTARLRAEKTGQGGDMVEPPFAVPSEVVSERDVLLATKLHVPRPRPDLVPRPRLAERLDEGVARGLMLVCAPAGYGKTILLADWVRRSQQPVAWLSLDVGDNDPARFWRHGVAALNQGRPGLAERVGPLLGPPAPSSYEGLVTALINELAAGPDADQALLVLDEQALEAIAVPGRPLPPTAGPVYLGLAEVAYQRNELDRALRYVSEGIALSRQFL